jgi:tRNA (guanine26-N2/guanine27-N2)-dimethyltransferase
MTTGQPVLIREGSTEVYVFSTKGSAKGPSVKDHAPFYNPSMELNRDVSILVNQWFLTSRTKHGHILDGLAASGIRGIRFAHELTGDFEVSINDWDDQCVSLIKQNIKRNRLGNVSVCQRNLNSLLSEQRFDSIDVDPFGSPVYFFDAALRSVVHKGIIACTATDSATLCGVFPSVCFRRYAAWPLHGPSMHEVGLRILLGCLCREAAKYDRSIEPFLCYATDHYLRTYVRVTNGKAAANKSMASFQSIMSTSVPLSQGTAAPVGPLWMGTLQDASVIQEIRALLPAKQLHSASQLRKLLLLLEDEAEGPPFFYTTNDLSSHLGCSPPSMGQIVDYLQARGYIVTRTHSIPTGFKTDAPLGVIAEVFK